MKKKTENHVCSGIAFINRIDLVLKEQQRTRKSLCESLGILQGTMATWKTKDIMPPIDTIVQIAKALDVSTDWLLTGKDFCYTDKKKDLNEEKINRNINITRLESIRDNVNLLLSQYD